MHTPAIAIAHSDAEYSRHLFDQLRLRAHFMDFRLANGLEALNYLINQRPDVIILEEELPILSAIDLIKMANYKEIRTRFIVLSKNTTLPDFSKWYDSEPPLVLLQQDSIDTISRSIGLHAQFSDLPQKPL